MAEVPDRNNLQSHQAPSVALLVSGEQRLKGQQEHSVDSTPTFIINGTKLVGAQSLAAFKAAIDGLLE